jgi:hypothetical protein
MRRLTDLFRRDRQARRQGEADAPADLGTSRTRDSGGEPEPGAQDQNSTTGTTPNDNYVGRAGGDESGDVGLSGAEARREGQDVEHEGALRDEEP